MEHKEDRPEFYFTASLFLQVLCHYFLKSSFPVNESVRFYLLDRDFNNSGLQCDPYLHTLQTSSLVWEKEAYMFLGNHPRDRE